MDLSSHTFYFPEKSPQLAFKVGVSNCQDLDTVLQAFTRCTVIAVAYSSNNNSNDKKHIMKPSLEREGSMNMGNFITLCGKVEGAGFEVIDAESTIRDIFMYFPPLFRFYARNHSVDFRNGKSKCQNIGEVQTKFMELTAIITTCEFREIDGLDYLVLKPSANLTESKINDIRDSLRIGDFALEDEDKTLTKPFRDMKPQGTNKKGQRRI
ncbi:hypothetical protein H4R24_001839 [Coemansia sp. RSA 988]|nr:hypothetical protein H4R24_001839 [Coemansia sp. RSA 988]